MLYLPSKTTFILLMMMLGLFIVVCVSVCVMLMALRGLTYVNVKSLTPPHNLTLFNIFNPNLTRFVAFMQRGVFCFTLTCTKK